MSYTIISPDERPAFPDDFPTLRDAQVALLEFTTRYERQGYYTTMNGERIPWDKLHSRCALTSDTPLEWADLWAAIDADHEAGRSGWQPTTDAMYWNQLEVVPPAAMGHGAFLVGEAWNHNAEGYAVYACFRRTSDNAGDTYECRRMTRPQFRAEYNLESGREGDLRPYACSDRD